MPGSVGAQQQQIIDDLLIIEDVHERLNAVVLRAASGALHESHRVDSCRVPGCVSRVWLAPEMREGRCYFPCDAESPMVKGLVALLCSVYDGGEPAEVIATEPVLWERLGLAKMLTPTRLNGLAAVRSAIKAFAQRQLA